LRDESVTTPGGMKYTMKTWQFALCLPLIVAGCSKTSSMHSKTASTKPFNVKTVTRTVTDVNADNIQRTAGIQVSPEIAKVCDLPMAHFDFDSAEIKGDAATALDKLAGCFTQGKLAGRSMKIVGHADPRGTQEYNFALGQRRAGAVAEYLNSKGLGQDKIETSSMGELGASGTDEQSWAADRRVEILLGDEAVLMPTGGQPQQDTKSGDQTYDDI
jgi:peptidoglycan-associated lipoprotein